MFNRQDFLVFSNRNLFILKYYWKEKREKKLSSWVIFGDGDLVVGVYRLNFLISE